MLRRWRTAVALGAAAITACLVVDVIAIVFGVAAAGSVAVLFDPLAGILAAVALVAIGVAACRRYRRSGRRCNAKGYNVEVSR